MLYEALRVIAGLFFEFTSVKMKGPNKQIKTLKNFGKILCSIQTPKKI